MVTRRWCMPLLWLALLTPGCTSLGARALQGERVHLNASLQQTNDEQLLLNLVRLRYRDTPAFLEVSSISSQLRLEATVAAGVELEGPPVDPTLLQLGGTAGYATQPTLTYTPLQGEHFIQRLLTPLTLEKLLLLSRSGWNLKRVLLLCVQRLGGVKNAPRASGPTPGRAPEYQAFLRVLALLQELEQHDRVALAYDALPAPDARLSLILQIAPEATDAPEVVELRWLLHLTPARTQYPLVYAPAPLRQAQPQEVIGVDTRSLLGILFYLSHAVEVPAADVHRGKVTVTRTETGEPFDWGKLLGETLQIHAEGSRPAEVAIAVRYRGAWFFIRDDDLESKSTFAMLAQLFALQAGQVERIVPILTLPVGR